MSRYKQKTLFKKDKNLPLSKKRSKEILDHIKNDLFPSCDNCAFKSNCTKVGLDKLKCLGNNAWKFYRAIEEKKDNWRYIFKIDRNDVWYKTSITLFWIQYRKDKKVMEERDKNVKKG